MLGMAVAQKLRRNTNITVTTRIMVRSSVNCTSPTDARIVVVRSLSSETWSARGARSRSAEASSLSDRPSR